MGGFFFFSGMNLGSDHNASSPFSLPTRVTLLWLSVKLDTLWDRVSQVHNLSSGPRMNLLSSFMNHKIKIMSWIDSGIFMVSHVECISHILNMIKPKIYFKCYHVKFMVFQSLSTAKDLNSNKTNHRGGKFYFQIPCAQTLSGSWPVLFSSWWLLAKWMPLV